MLPIECIVRGYLAGSAWREYQEGIDRGLNLPEGMQECEELPEPLFTPSTKAEVGHDENISKADAADIVGNDVMHQAEELSLTAYGRAREHARERGVLLLDTKFELGFIDGVLSICDEVLTPDSSRFVDASRYQVGTMPPSLDKEPIRTWAKATGWDLKPPAPPLESQIIQATRDRYIMAYERITGRAFSDWPGVQQAA
jgi:phosphoribosylaminoimidazole-succinocarboxamide synthase